MNYNDYEPIIKVCRNCHGTEPCLCDKHDYIEMWQFVYNAMKAVNPG